MEFKYISLEELIKNHGCKRIKRDDFDFKEWDSNYTDDLDELKKRLDSMNLIGRKIQDIRFISYVYNMSEDELSERIYNITEGYPKELHDYISELQNVDNFFPYPLDLRMDEPVLIMFEDGDQFEIAMYREGYCVVDMNKIPWNAKGIVNRENVNGSILYDLILGAEITKVEIREFKDLERAYSPFTEEKAIEGVVLHLNKEDDYFELVFRSEMYDYMEVSVEKFRGYVMHVPFIKVKQSMYIDDDPEETEASDDNSSSEKTDDRPPWNLCASANIVKTWIDENGLLKHGTAQFSGGTKVYLCGKNWDECDNRIGAIGLNRHHRYQWVWVPVAAVENVRLQTVYKPSVVRLMDDFEGAHAWWHRTGDDKREIKQFIERWNRVNGRKATPNILPDEPIFMDDGDTADEDPTRKRSYLDIVTSMLHGPV